MFLVLASVVAAAVVPAAAVAPAAAAFVTPASVAATSTYTGISWSFAKVKKIPSWVERLPSFLSYRWVSLRLPDAVVGFPTRPPPPHRCHS